MSQRKNIFMVTVSTLIFYSACGYADVVYLKSGEKIEGKVLAEKEGIVRIIADTEKGIVVKKIPAEEVEKTQKADGFEDLYKRYTEATALYRQANKAFESNEYYWAMENYKKVVELNPKFAEAHFNLGVSYAALKYFGKARQSLERAEELAQTIENPTEKDTALLGKIKELLLSLEQAVQ